MEIERTMKFIAFILKSCNLKFGMHVVKTLFYFIKLAEYTYFFIFIVVRRERVEFYLSQSKTSFFMYGTWCIIQFGPKTGILCLKPLYLIKNITFISSFSTGDNNEIVKYVDKI